jgi:GH25 family lysozyme M1 (1,4-beta-N-acetylmuramidase)
MANRSILFLTVATLVFAACARSAPADRSQTSSAPNGQTSVPDAPMFAQPFPDDAQKYDNAWKRADTMIVIDAFEGNSIDWTQMATDPRVIAVIHRATIGLQVDAQYKSRQMIAQSRGYLWGAYHLGKSGDPIAQAKFFLSTIGDPTNVLMALDLENTSGRTMMNIANAKIFLNYVFQQTGRMPIVYANNKVVEAINASMKGDIIFAQTRLWYARFVSKIPSFPAGVWSSYFLWQFSSEINCSSTGHCLYNVPGTSYDMDVDVFYGDKAALADEWAS